MSFKPDDATREEYTIQLLEEISIHLKYLCAMFESVHETGLNPDDGEDLDNGV